MRRGLLSVSVDLDPLSAYHAIHGLDPVSGADADHLSALAIPRFLELFERLGIRATFFVVGRDLRSERVVSYLRQAVDAGHELGNHTHSHPYDFLDRSPALRASEVADCHARIADATGVTPVGFRAPGYYLDGVTLALLADSGYQYDSSMLASLPYYAAKLGVMGMMRLRGRRSHSRLHPPTCVLAPDRPYRPDPAQPWRRGKSPLMELPAASLVAGVPLVGTFLGKLYSPAARLLAHWLSLRRFVSVEFHGIDLVDLSDGGLEGLRGVQPGLEVPLQRRLTAYEPLLAALTRSHESVPLHEASQHFGAQ